MARFKPVITCIFLLLTLTTLAACGGKKDDAKADAVKVDKPVVVDTAKAEVKEVQRTVGFVGTLKASEEALVASTLELPVEKVYVDLGDRVAKGALLVKLDDERSRIRVAQEEAALKQALAQIGVEDEKDLVVDNVSYVRKARAVVVDAEGDLKRMKDLYDKGYVSKADLDKAQSRYDSEKAGMSTQMEYGMSLYSQVKARRAALAMAKKELKDTEVRAPFAGYVSMRWVDPGNFVKVGGSLITLVDVDPLKLTGDVPEVNAPDVKTGQVVKVSFSASPGKEYTGRITRISPASSLQSRAFSVEAFIPNGDAGLKPGYFAEADILTRLDPDALTVPVGSLMVYAGITKLFVAEDGKAKERVVTPGARVGDMREVKGDVKPGDMVITTGMSMLYDGKAVEVRKAR